MAFNDNYNEMEEGFAGMIADAATLSDKRTYVQGEVSAETPFGIVLAQGDVSTVQGTPDDAILPVDANSRHVGVLIHAHSYAPDVALGTTGVKPKQLINAMQSGRIYAWAEAGTYVKGAQLYVRHTANGAGKLQKGAVRPDADTANARLNKGITVARPKVLATPGYVCVDVSIPVDRAS